MPGLQGGWLAEEMPGFVGIRSEDFWRHILAEVPGGGAVVEREINRGEIADMAAIARADDKGCRVSFAEVHIVTSPWMRNIPSTGLRQAITAALSGDGCVATLCAFIRPGVRTSVAEELASGSHSRQPWPVRSRTV